MYTSAGVPLGKEQATPSFMSQKNVSLSYQATSSRTHAPGLDHILEDSESFLLT